MENKTILTIALTALIPFFLIFNIYSQPSQKDASVLKEGEYKSAAESQADKEFRSGVQAFYRGSYNEAILQFEKTLTYLPESPLTLDWLGRAYYYTGLEGTALKTWGTINKKEYGGLLLSNKIDIIKERRVLLNEDKKQAKYTEAGSFYGYNNNTLIYAQAVAAVPNIDGSSWVTAYGSNELLLLDVNGFILQRITGPINGFDHPLDIIRLKDGNLLISETMGDRLALLNSNGGFIRYIGSKGRGLGQVVSPQYLAQDSRGNIFATDYGNKRVTVFDKEGKGIFSFGEEEGSFIGFKGPTGIAIIEDTVFVCDNILGSIYKFDNAGNYLGQLVEDKKFSHPEGLKVWGDTLVLCDNNTIYSIDRVTGAVYENATTGNAPSRLMSATPDINGNVLVPDIKANEIYIMAEMQDIIGGLFIQIEKINAQNFPKITTDIKVENRFRRPLVGLKEKNFYLSENNNPVANLEFLGSHAQDTDIDITILIDRSEDNKGFTTDGALENAVRSIAASMNSNEILRIVSAGAVPTLEYIGNAAGALMFNPIGLKTPLAKVVPLDAAFRLCANDLINAKPKRAIIMLGSGNVTPGAFDKYSLSETTSYLNNNNIACAYVTESNKLDESFKYIIDNTQGEIYYIWRPEGLGNIIEDIKKIPCGIYTFSYTSQLNSNYGEKYLPLEVQTFLLNRSGQDKTGYYAPLE